MYVIYRFDDKEHLTAVNNVKSSIQKGIRSKIIEQFPYLEDYLEQVIPKKDPMRIAKWWFFFHWNIISKWFQKLLLFIDLPLIELSS